MNRDDLRHLLTAAIDGALTPAERKEAQRLVRQSAEARALYHQLKRDADRLKALRRHHAPPDLADAVMGAIRDRKPTPLPPERCLPPRWAGWMSIATAASVLLIVGAVGLLLLPPDRGVALARYNAVVPNPVPIERPTPSEIGPVPRSVPGDSVAVLPKSAGPERGPRAREVFKEYLAPPDSDSPDIRPLQLDALRLSTFFTLRDLPGDDGEQAKLLGEVKKDELIRLDLFTSKLPQGTELVLNALRTRGIEVHADAFAQERRKKNPTTELVLFTEAMTPAEMVKLLTALGAEDRRWPSPVFDTLVVAPFLPKDLTQLTTLLGLPAIAAPEKVDVRKPLPEGTANQVAATLTRMGGSGSPSAAPKSNKVAVMMAYAPANPSPAASRDIQQFLARRGDRKADAKPLMLVLRSK